MKFLSLLSFVAVASAVPEFAKPVKNCEVIGTVPNPSPAADSKAPEQFIVSFETNVVIAGIKARPIVLEVTRSWAPLETKKWDTIIVDDPVVVSNTNWTVSYATGGADTRTSQIFINYVDNSRLDESGFTPFAKVISGFETALNVVNPTPDSSDGVSQPLYTKKGNGWLLDKYPNISLIACTGVSGEK
eukprot:gene32994-40722_t